MTSFPPFANNCSFPATNRLYWSNGIQPKRFTFRLWMLRNYYAIATTHILPVRLFLLGFYCDIISILSRCVHKTHFPKRALKRKALLNHQHEFPYNFAVYIRSEMSAANASNEHKTIIVNSNKFDKRDDAVNQVTTRALRWKSISKVIRDGNLSVKRCQ